MKDFLKNFQTSLLLAALLLFSFNLIAQGNGSGYLYVYPSDPSAYPDQQGNPTNLILQGIFQQYQVALYTKSFPGSQSELLENAYEIHCLGDELILQTALQSTGLFSMVEWAEYYQMAGCPTECDNPMTLNDPNAGYQFDLTQAGCAWTVTQGNPDVVVAVADSYFDLSNDDLNDGQIISIWGPNTHTSLHGTRVAGMIVATPNNGIGTAGLAPNIKVAAYSMSDGLNWCFPWIGIWQAYKDGHKIINASWSGIHGQPSTIVNAVKEMTGSGVLLVVAAGNDDPGNPTSHDVYADIPGVVMVSSVSADGSIHPSVDYNEHVDLCAPGNGTGCLDAGTCWGTSQSAPAVCAAAGLILSVNECLAPAEIENILKSTACPMTLPSPPAFEPNWVGAGYLNMYQAVLMAQGRSGMISQNEPPWEGVTYVPSNLTIASGVTLTINGTVKFSEGASLIIEPGGRVNLYGTFTNSCMGPWDGVIVEGMNNESQWTSGKHGRLNTFEGALIENAITGVKLVDGGILSAKGTSFKNNGTGLAYSPYSNFWPIAGSQFGQPRNHFGGFNNCTFLSNDDFNKAVALGAGIQMEGVRGIGINGCSFLNERTIKNPMGNNDYGYGIKATDARFTVASLGIGNTFPPSSYDHSVFKGLGYGIYVGSAQTPNDNGTPSIPNDDFITVPYTVQQATFTECIYGIHNRFVSQGIIVGNTFNMGKLPAASPLSGGQPYTNEQFGVFFENGANGFELQENQFFKVPDNVDFAYGSYCQNLGWFNNDIRRNSYTNVNYGNLADDDNAVLLPSRGLHYLCNTNITQRYDFYVFPGGDIRQAQGLEVITPNGIVLNAAGNTFTKAHAPNGDFANNGPFAWYYHHGQPERPMFFSGLAFFDVLENNCASDYCLPPCREQSEWPAMKAEYTVKRSLYQTAVSEMQGALAIGNQALADQKANVAAAHRLRLDELSKLLSLHMAVDTITYSVDTVRAWWQKMDSPVSEMVVARDFLAKGQNTTAFSVLDAVPTKYGLSENGLSDLADFRSIMQLMQSESAGALPENKVQQLLNYANNGSGISAAWAKNILTIKGCHFPPISKHPEGYENRGSQQQSMQADTLNNLYVVTPNPANEYVQFVCTVTQHCTHSVVITDATGRPIWHSPANQEASTYVWQTTDIKSGIYFYTIYDESGLIQSGRIAVVK